MCAWYMHPLLNNLQTIIDTHLAEINLQNPSPQISLEYRTVIYVLYAHLRFLLTVIGPDTPDQHAAWGHKFRDIINSIHIAFNTQQVTPYHQWPDQ